MRAVVVVQGIAVPPRLVLVVLAVAATALSVVVTVMAVSPTRVVVVVVLVTRLTSAATVPRALSSSDTRWPHNG
jgi:hypothetical protein